MTHPIAVQEFAVQGRGRPIRVEIRERVSLTAAVVSLELAPVDGGSLPEWQPGAHIAMHIPNGMERQFSLCGDPNDLTTYRIAILRETDGRGGSEFIHTKLHNGDGFDISEPLNTFGFAGSPRYRFIAAGVGITPIVSMLHAAEAAHADWALTYLGRSRSTMPFVDELLAFGRRVSVLPADEVGRQHLPTIVGEPSTNTLIYACGPESVLSGLERAMAMWPPGSLHVERFAPKERSALPTRQDSFEVRLVHSGLTLQISAGESILETVENAGVMVPSSCREGTCGTCETSIVAGVADHRDSVLSPKEQCDGESMMICVSRAKTPMLELDL